MRYELSECNTHPGTFKRHACLIYMALDVIKMYGDRSAKQILIRIYYLTSIFTL